MREKNGDFNKGLRLGIGAMMCFVITPLLMILLPLPRWTTALIGVILWSATIFWLVAKNDSLK